MTTTPDSLPLTPPVTRRRLLLGIIPGLMAFSMGQTVLFAIAGPVFRDIGLAESQLGMIISAAAVVFIAASAAWGAISDRWGRKPTIVVGLVSYGVMSLAFTLVLEAGLEGTLTASTVFVGLLVLRLLYAALGAGIQPASVALMADVSSEHERSSAVAVVGVAFGLGMVLGPASAALLVGFGVLVPLYVIALLGLAGAILAWVLLPAHTLHPDAENAETSPLPLSVLWLLIAGAFVLYLGMSVIQQTMAFNVQDLLGVDSESTARYTGLLFMLIAVGTLLIQAIFIQLMKPGPVLLLTLGLPIIVLGHLLYLNAASLSMLAVAAACMGLGFGMTTPGISAAASIIVGSASQGRVAGLLQAAMAGGFVLGPVAGTTMYEWAPVYAAQLALAAATLASVLMGIWILRRMDGLKAASLSAA